MDRKNVIFLDSLARRFANPKLVDFQALIAIDWTCLLKKLLICKKNSNPAEHFDI
jgi:hypothetical protein